MLETLLIVFSLSMDAFVTSFAYGSTKTKISFLKKIIITSISSGILIVAMFLGTILQKLFPEQNTLFICTVLLGTLGMIQLTQFFLKTYLNKQPNGFYASEFKLFDIHFKFKVTLPKPSSLIENFKTLSIKETLFLGTALSLDSVGIGIGMGLVQINFIQVLGLSIIMNLIMLSIGNSLGYRLSQRLEVDLSWLSGAILIFLATSKLT